MRFWTEGKVTCANDARLWVCVGQLSWEDQVLEGGVILGSDQ